MIDIAVASKNPTKLRAVELATKDFGLWSPEKHITVRSIPVESGVSDQPMSDEEMIKGATNRVDRIMTELPMGSPINYVVGLEGGIRVLPEGWFDLGWVQIAEVASGKRGLGSTPALAVPKAVQKVMEEQDLELSNAVAEIYQTDTVKSRDCSGVISGGVLPAEILYKMGVLSAMAALRSEVIIMPPRPVQSL